VGRGNNDNGALKDIQGAFTAIETFPTHQKPSHSLLGDAMCEIKHLPITLGAHLPLFPNCQKLFLSTSSCDNFQCFLQHQESKALDGC
jgi:hypothetical protein